MRFTNNVEKLSPFLEEYLTSSIRRLQGFGAVICLCFPQHTHIIGLINRLENITNNFPVTNALTFFSYPLVPTSEHKQCV